MVLEEFWAFADVEREVNVQENSVQIVVNNKAEGEKKKVTFFYYVWAWALTLDVCVRNTQFFVARLLA